MISPLLANIYLHDVLDVWFERFARPKLSGRVQSIRFADDLVLLCEHESDARRLYDAIPARFQRFGLELHLEKTRLIPFRKPPLRPRGGGSGDGNVSESWEFLGFTHYLTKLHGPCAYYGIAGNAKALWQSRHEMEHIWRKWLMRRSGGSGRKRWAWWDALKRRYPLPAASPVHSIYRPVANPRV